MTSFVPPAAGAPGSSPVASARLARAPALRRRLACFVYEGVLLFGVVMAAGLVYSIATGQRHALKGLHGMQAWIFLVLAAYFVGFWTRRGQTLPMQTWQIRLVDAATGGLPSVGRALVRYLLSWIWFVPALVIVQMSGLKSLGALSGVLLVGVLVWAALSRLHPQRQFWHDAVCGTRLVDLRPAARTAAAPASPPSSSPP